jgi:hypothetical protein
MARPTSSRALENERKLAEIKVEYATEVYGVATAYDNVILLAGYAAFFGLWAGVSGDVTPACRLITAALMGVSLFCYILWQIAQMWNRQRFEIKQADAIVELEHDPSKLLVRFDQIKQARIIATNKLIARLYLPTFIPTVAFGFAGGLTLTWNTAMRALGIPLELSLS